MDTTAKLDFDDPGFQEQYHCDEALGAFCGEEGTEFCLWAPTAESVTLRLYAAGYGGEPWQTAPLRREARGLWRYRCDRNLDGVYYDYLVTVSGVTRQTADPYARACGKNGGRSMVIDLSGTNPEGWLQDGPPPMPPEAVIYELHVKEFTWDASSGVEEAYRGKFKGLCQEGTTLNGDGVHPTGLAYIKALGVTYVQLMPVFDYGSVDEGGDPEQFNWGYDPVNYNVPEGSYATDWENGAVRIRELKQTVQALHKNGLRVIMDVVYNHTYRPDSWLERTVPGYYYRQNPDGSPSNGSGCGNDLASQRSMCGKYILDSVLFWAEEYHMDGFRFDLMGLLDVALMNRIRRELDARYGVGEKIMLGEPWSAAPTAVKPDTILADKAHLSALEPGIAAFCDGTRDAVRGDLWRLEAAGFVNGGGLEAEDLIKCLKGRVSEGGPVAPSQTVNYRPATTTGRSGISSSTPGMQSAGFRIKTPFFCGRTGWRRRFALPARA